MFNAMTLTVREALEKFATLIFDQLNKAKANSIISFARVLEIDLHSYS